MKREREFFKKQVRQLCLPHPGESRKLLLFKRHGRSTEATRKLAEEMCLAAWQELSGSEYTIVNELWGGATRYWLVVYQPDTSPPESVEDGMTEGERLQKEYLEKEIQMWKWLSGHRERTREKYCASQGEVRRWDRPGTYLCRGAEIIGEENGVFHLDCRFCPARRFREIAEHAKNTGYKEVKHPCCSRLFPFLEWCGWVTPRRELAEEMVKLLEDKGAFRSGNWIFEEQENGKWL